MKLKEKVSRSSAARDMAILETIVRGLYHDNASRVPFHNWDHTNFVRNKAVMFAGEIGADEFVVEAAALVHDLNHIVEGGSVVGAGTAMRQDALKQSGFNEVDQERIERIIFDAHTSNRADAFTSNEGCRISSEAMALSDADTLFKVQPITPMLFSALYLSETGASLLELADKIRGEQKPLLDGDVLFYTGSAKRKYSELAKANIEFWQMLRLQLEDSDVAELVRSRGINPGV